MTHGLKEGIQDNTITTGLIFISRHYLNEEHQKQRIIKLLNKGSFFAQEILMNLTSRAST